MEEADGGNKKSPVCKDGEAKLEDDSPPTPVTSNSEEAKPTLAANVNTSKIPTSKKKEEAKKEAVGGGPSPSHSPLTGKDTKGPAKDPGKKSKAPGGKDKASGRTSEVTPEAQLVIGPSMLLHEQRRNCLSQAAGIINDGANFQASLASSAMNLSLHPIKLPYLIKQPNFKPSFKNLPSQIIVFLPLLICQSLLIWMIPW